MAKHVEAKSTPYVRPVATMRRVSKTYRNGTIALSDVNLTIKRGEFVALLGPSGCGKSTALKIIAGLSKPSTGEVDWPSSRIDSRGRPEAGIGYVFQDPTLMPWATVFGNVYLPLRLAGMSKRKARERIMDALGSVGLNDFSEAYPRELSGGMKMRVSLARALVTQPKLLLMDEPFAALDEITRQRLNDDVLSLSRAAGLTVVFVTHSVFEAGYLASRVVVMHSRPGRVAHELKVEAPWPRSQNYRLTEGFNRTCSEISRLMEGRAASAGVGDA